MNYKNLQPHPIADVFPMIPEDSKQWEELKYSILDIGQQNPIVLYDGMVLDGRNRLKACIEMEVEPKFINFEDTGYDGDDIEWYVLAQNAHRRHLTKDQLDAATLGIFQYSQKRADEKQKAAQFKKGVCPNPAGRGGKEQADTVSCPPVSGQKPERDIKQKNAQSTVGQVAAKAGVSMHKARQVVAVAKAIESGELPEETVKKVQSGEVKLKDAAKKVADKKHIKKTKEALPLEKRFKKEWEKFIGRFPLDDHDKLFDLIRDEIG